MDPSKARVPPMMDMTIDNITANTVLINSQGPDVRLTFVLERLVRHMHDFARETRLSSKEWMAGIHFLTEVGHTCTDVRQVGGTDHPGLLEHVLIDAILIGIHPPFRHPRPFLTR